MGAGSSAVFSTAAAAAAAATTTPSPNWRVFVCNAYLIPAFTVNKDNATCTLQDERAAALGRVIAQSKPDVVQLQEMWGAGMAYLEQELVNAGFSVGDWCKSFYGFTFIDSVTQFAMARGGLYFANSQRAGVTTLLPPMWRSYSISKTASKKGMVANLYGKKGQSSALLVVNTHDDPMNIDNVQLKQMAELADFVAASVRTAAAHLATSGAEGAARGAAAESAQDTRTAPPPPPPAAAAAAAVASSTANAPALAVIIVGDLNFTPTSSQYKELFSIFKKSGVDLREILSSTLHTHTYAAENKLVQWKESAGRLDHCMAVDRVGDIDLKKIQLVSEKVRSDVLVSDHYPFEVELRI